MSSGTQTRRVSLMMGALLVVAAVLAAPRVTAKMPDVEVYRTAAQRAWQGAPLYRADDGHYQFKYLPAFAVLASPMAPLSAEAVKLSWFAASVALLVVALRWSLDVVSPLRVPAWWLVLACLVTLGKFYAHELVLGQVNLLLLMVVLGVVRALQRGREYQAGLLVALAVVVKPHALLLVPWLASRRSQPALAGAGVGLFAVLLLPMLCYGVEGTVAQHVAWAASVTASTPALLFNQDNISLAGVAARYAGDGTAGAWPGAAAVALLLAVAALVMVWRRRVAAPDALEVSVLLMLMPLISPQGWDYVLLTATPAVMLLAAHAERMTVPSRLLVAVSALAMGLSLFDVLGRDGYRSFMMAGGITWCALGLLTGLVTLRRAGHA